MSGPHQKASGQRGVVLAVNCTPPEADPQVYAFWMALHRHLAALGYRLVLASTMPLDAPEVDVIEIPFLLPDFPRRYPTSAKAPGGVSGETLSELARWYGCSVEEAEAGHGVATACFDALIDAVRPVAVMGWQSANPVTRILRGCARALDVPFWSGERGWVRNTLMFDLVDNSLLSECRLSLGLATARARYVPAEGLLEDLTHRACAAASLARYPAEERVDGAALRSRLGVPPDAPVVAVFTHGEPSFAAYGSSAAGPLHDLSPELLQRRMDAVTDELLARGCWLLVQEHPFNHDNGRLLRLRTDPRVIPVKANVSSVLDAADVCLFTIATLQFDAVFLDKPFGLLSRSVLHGDGLVPMVGDYADTAAFVDALIALEHWPARRERLCVDIAFLFEHLLLDVAPGAVDASAARWAGHLAGLARPRDADIQTRLSEFRARWTPPVEHTGDELPAVAASLSRPFAETVDAEGGDPLLQLERALAATPPERPLDAAERASFQRRCQAMGLRGQVEIDAALLRRDATTQPLLPSLVVAELMLALGETSLAHDLASVLASRFPLDQRVRDLRSSAVRPVGSPRDGSERRWQPLR